MPIGEDPELVSEFKTAATAVTKLFKLASTNNQNAYQQGYMDALRRLLDQLEVDEDTNVQQWAVHQLTGLTQDGITAHLHQEHAEVGDKRPYCNSVKKRIRHDNSSENPDSMSL